MSNPTDNQIDDLELNESSVESADPSPTDVQTPDTVLAAPNHFGFPLDQMTSGEKLDELVWHARSIVEALQSFQKMNAADMMKMFFGGKRKD
jgi:hypothetical protein